MAQGPLQVAAAITPTSSAFTANKGTPLRQSLEGGLLTGQGLKNALNKTAGTTLVQGGPGRVAKVIVNTVDSTQSAIYDAATTGGAAAGTLVFNIPKTVGIYSLDFPFVNGIVLTVGTGGVVSLSFA